MVSILGWFVVVLVVLVIATVVFVVVRSQRRAGHVIATRKTKR